MEDSFTCAVGCSKDHSSTGGNILWIKAWISVCTTSEEKGIVKNILKRNDLAFAVIASIVLVTGCSNDKSSAKEPDDDVSTVDDFLEWARLS